MSDIAKAFMDVMAIAGFAMAVTSGVAVVCKLMRWAPVNVSITIHNYQQNEDA